jgi:hypothetical protein
MMEIEKDAAELYGQMITLLLAWQTARYEGKNEAGRVKKCARKLMSETKDPESYAVFKKIARCQSDFKVIETVKLCYEENKRLGYL